MLSEYNLEVLTFNLKLLLFNYEFQSSEVQIYIACKYVCKSSKAFKKHCARHERQTDYFCLLCPKVTSKYRWNILCHVKKQHADMNLSPAYYITID